MEKVVVRIGKYTKHSSEYRKSSVVLNDLEEVNWLKSTFEISQQNADRLFKNLNAGVSSVNVSAYFELTMSYRQLARYTIKRQVDNLVYYWKYPSIIKFEEGLEEPFDIRNN